MGEEEPSASAVQTVWNFGQQTYCVNVALRFLQLVCSAAQPMTKTFCLNLYKNIDQKNL